MSKLGVMEYIFLVLYLLLTVLCCIHTYVIHSNNPKIAGRRFSDKYRPIASSAIILVVCSFLVVEILLSILLGGDRQLLYLAYLKYSPGFVVVSVYYCILLALLPVFRKVIRPGTCAILWQLSYLAIIASNYGGTNSDIPNLIIPIHENFARILPSLFWVWVIGFAIVFGWNILSHIRYRRWVLEDAQQVQNPEILEIWRYESMLGSMSEHPMKLVISSRVWTPLSIGLLRGSTYVILPDKQYSEDELHLVLRHELIHVGRQDMVLKFFLMTTTALLWFNPLMWVAKRCCSDDLELGCDELVVQHTEHTKRKQYAELLLKTAGDNRGFTTCLSASARAMRYRLKNIMADGKRLAGGVLVGVTALVLLGVVEIWHPLISFSYHPGTASERIFAGQPAEEVKFEHIRLYQYDPVEDKGWLVRSESGDGEAIVSYLYSLHVSELIAECVPKGQDAYSYVEFRSDERYYLIFITEKVLHVYTSSSDGEKWECFALCEPVDEDYLWSLCEPQGEREYVD